MILHVDFGNPRSNAQNRNGEEAKYAALHLRVQRLRGKPRKCEICGTTQAKRFEWANLTGNYADPMDYKRMCGSCHHKYDGTAANFGDYAIPKSRRGVIADAQ